MNNIESLKVTVLMTGSDGNCSLIQYRNTNILLDAGFKSQTKCKETLKDILEKIKIDAILISHEHTDHFSVWTGRLAIDLDIPIYLHKRHYENEENRKVKYLSCERKKEGVTYKAKIVDIEEDVVFNIGDLKIEPFSVFHDAKKTLGFVFNDNQLCWVTDCGFLSTNIKEKIKKCKNVALEMNYDLKKIMNSERHWMNKLRTLGKFGHLNIEEALKFLNTIEINTLITLHSSNQHSSLEDIEKQLYSLLEKKKLTRFFVSKRENNRLIELW